MPNKRARGPAEEFPFGAEEPDNVIPLHRDGVLRASDFRMRAARYLWHPYLPLGKITMFDGDPSQGKSQVTVELAARIITGTPMPDTGVVRRIRKVRNRLSPRGVVMICAEDDWADTVLPRLYVAVRAVCPGISPKDLALAMNRVAVVGMKKSKSGDLIPPEFPRDAALVRKAIEAVDAALVVVDPIMAFFQEGTNTNSDASVRKALGPFKELAAQTGAAFVLIRHLNKQVDLKAEYRGGGSHGGFIGLARSGWLVGEHPDEPGTFVLVHAKANLTQRGRSVTYLIVGEVVADADGVEMDTSRIEWGEGVDMDANTLLRGHDSRKDAPERERCWEEIQVLLSEQDPRPAEEMLSMLRKAGFTSGTAKNAKSHYGVVSRRRRDANGRTSGWEWTLIPEGDEQNGPGVRDD